jgi:hypothetical protein
MEVANTLAYHDRKLNITSSGLTFVRLGSKGFVGINALAYLVSSSVMRKKSFMTLTPVIFKNLAVLFFYNILDSFLFNIFSDSLRNQKMYNWSKAV